MFQSTFPQGERLDACPAQYKIIIRFNPRSRKGNDITIQHQPTEQNGFNPRSRKGNDTMRCARFGGMRVSIHVPARGTTAITYNFYL